MLGFHTFSASVDYCYILVGTVIRHQTRDVEYAILLNGPSADDEIAIAVRRYQESHIAEDPSTILVIPGKVDGSFWNVQVAGNSSAASLFLLGQLAEPFWRVFEYSFNELTRHDIAL